jgi:hypothetical protein
VGLSLLGTIDLTLSVSYSFVEIIVNLHLGFANHGSSLS